VTQYWNFHKTRLSTFTRTCRDVRWETLKICGDKYPYRDINTSNYENLSISVGFICLLVHTDVSKI